MAIVASKVVLKVLWLIIVVDIKNIMWLICELAQMYNLCLQNKILYIY